MNHRPIQIVENRLSITSTKGSFVEIVGGNLDANTSQKAFVRIVKSPKGEKFVAKLAFKKKGYTHLLSQLIRIQLIQNAGLKITPQILEFDIQEDYIYYIMTFVEGVSGYQKYLRDILSDEEFLLRFKDLLHKLNFDLWARGKTSYETKYFSNRHDYVIKRGLDAYARFSHESKIIKQESLLINGAKTPNLKQLLDRTKALTKNFNKIMSICLIPEFSHGDLHFENMIIDRNFEISLIDINGSDKREKNIIEFELGRLMMSFYREIISNKHYKIANINDKDIKVIFTQEGKRNLKRRKLAYDVIFANTELNTWFKNKEKSRKIVEFMEALHFVNVFGIRPNNEILPTYIMGILLLSNALRNGRFNDTKFWL